MDAIFCDPLFNASSMFSFFSTNYRRVKDKLAQQGCQFSERISACILKESPVSLF